MEPACLRRLRAFRLRRQWLGRQVGGGEELAGVGEPVGKAGIAFVETLGHGAEDLAREGCGGKWEAARGCIIKAAGGVWICLASLEPGEKVLTQNGLSGSGVGCWAVIKHVGDE